MANEDAITGEEDKSDPGLHRSGISAPTMIDLEKIADKVSQLMRDELRLEMARRGR